MDYKRFSRRELMEILEVIQSAIACKNEEDVKRLLEKTKELVCGDYSICGLGTYDNNGLSEVKGIINGSYPDGWFVAYEEEKLYEIDPIIGWHYKFFGTQLWADTYKVYKKEAHHKFIHNADSFGLKFGIAGSIPSQHSNLASIISFAGSKNHFGNHEKAIMDMLAPHFHQALMRVCREGERKPLSHLTPREKEIVKWIGAGKTDWEISMILRISERTVRFHITNIEGKFNAANKAHIAAIAAEQGEAD